MEPENFTDEDPGTKRDRSVVPYVQDGYIQPDEIDLVEIGAKLWQRWRLMLGIFLFFVAVGFAVAFIVPRPHTVTAVIAVGSYMNPAGRQVPLEPANTLVAAVQKAYLPAAILRVADRLHVPAREINIQAQSPARTNLIVLTGKATASKITAYTAVENEVSEMLVTRERGRVAVLRARLQQTLASEKDRLHRLQSKAIATSDLMPLKQGLLKAQLSEQNLENGANRRRHLLRYQRRIAKAKATVIRLRSELKALALQKSTLVVAAKLYHSEMKELRPHLAKIQKALLVASSRPQTPTRAATILLLSAQEQRAVNQLDSLQNKLLISLPTRREHLVNRILSTRQSLEVASQSVAGAEQALKGYQASYRRNVTQASAAITAAQAKVPAFIASNKLRIANQKAKIKSLEVRLSNVSQTQMVTPPEVSLRPSGIGRKLIVIAAVILGLLFALLGAGVANYLAAVRRRIRSRAGLMMETTAVV